MNVAKRALLASLLGLVGAWVFFMFGAWSELFFQPEYDSTGAWLNDGPIIRPQTFLLLAGIATFGLISLASLRTIAAEKAKRDAPDGLVTATYRFTNLAVIISLAGGAIYALVNFANAFDDRRDGDSLLERLIGVYVPIVLATALVVVILLFAFVFRRDSTPEQTSESKGLDARQKALGLGYALPIIAAAIAVIFGLVVYDVTGTTLEAWVWVIIQVIIASGIILGTRYARKARAEKPPLPKPRTAWASGAWNLNFVLSIVFGGVVSVMAFTFGVASFEQLRDYNYEYAGWEVKPFSFDWLLGDFSPALALMVLVVVGLYATITERHRAPEKA